MQLLHGDGSVFAVDQPWDGGRLSVEAVAQALHTVGPVEDKKDGEA